MVEFTPIEIENSKINHPLPQVVEFTPIEIENSKINHPLPQVV